MKAVILCSGEGQRLRPLTYEIPKPMIPVQGRPILEHTFDLLRKHGVKEVFISTYHLGSKIKEYFGDGQRFGVSITYIEEDALSGTAGPLRKIPVEMDESFFVLNGDELKDVDLSEMMRFHEENNAKVTIALTQVDDPSAYGVARLEDHRIVEFVEKPKKGDAPSDKINSGLYVFSPEVLKEIPEGFSMLEHEVFPSIAREGKLHGFIFSGQWFDTGSFDRYENAIKEWKGVSKE